VKPISDLLSFLSPILKGFEKHRKTPLSKSSKRNHHESRDLSQCRAILPTPNMSK